MPKIEFRGDWDPKDAEAIARSLSKSLSMGDIEDAGLSFPELLSARQKKLIELLKQGTRAALCEGEECDSDPVDWDEYSLKKAELSIGQVRHTPKGSFRLNSNRRWERIQTQDDALPVIKPIEASAVNWGAFRFPVEHGEFGDGVYFSVSMPLGGLRLRLSLHMPPNQIISDEEFYELEDDLTLDTSLILDSKGIRAIARTVGENVITLCIRDPKDINILGIVGGSGSVPQGTPAFNLVSVSRSGDMFTVEVEMIEASALGKTASVSRRSTFHSNSFLSGSPLVRTAAPALDRAMIRRAIARCKADGVPIDQVEISLVPGHPDFLSGMIRSYCLPSDGRICLAPHSPERAIASLAKDWAERMKVAVSVGVDAASALDVVAHAAAMSDEWWIEHLIKRYTGAILCDRAFGLLGGGNPPSEYMSLLVARGAGHWGDRRSVALCMAEDYRIAHDPAGLPNAVCAEWDLLLPGLARASQHLLSSLLDKKQV